MRRFVLVIHGGAGVVPRHEMTGADEEAYRAALEAALGRGFDILSRDGRSLDAVQAAVEVLEDSPLFNAGRGAVFTSAGTNELDAAIMSGRTLDAGAITGVKRIKNPIALARLVMEQSAHVMLAGEGAEVFAQQRGMALVPEEYFFTERRWESLQRARRVGVQAAADQHGTVGAVALDVHGDLAAGTSTGGITDKRPGRIGDSPVIGAGTYANDCCAVSATGHGEYFIRHAVAHDICARVEYKGQPVWEAADEVLKKLAMQGAEGGVVAVTSTGDYTMTFTSEGMFRGVMGPDGVPAVDIY
jgi:beta-aspartyl-peptidase (threonine type)